MGLQGANPKWVVVFFIVCLVLVFGPAWSESASNRGIPDAKTQLRSMGFVLVNSSDSYGAYVSLPGVAGNCRLSVYRKYKTWRLRKPSFAEKGSAITSAAQARKLPEVIAWCGLPKQ